MNMPLLHSLDQRGLAIAVLAVFCSHAHCLQPRTLGSQYLHHFLMNTSSGAYFTLENFMFGYFPRLPVNTTIYAL